MEVVLLLVVYFLKLCHFIPIYRDEETIFEL